MFPHNKILTYYYLNMLKCAEYYIENCKIEVFNNPLGSEKIFLNGRKVSEKRNKGGVTHKFSIGDIQYKIEHHEKLRFFRPYESRIKKNGQPISLINFLSNDSKFILFFVVIIGLGVGFILGRLIYQLIWPVVSI